MRWLFGLGVVAGGIALLAWSPKDAWSLAATLWGAVGVSVAVWWILEQHTEDVEQEVWLRRHRAHIVPILKDVRGDACLLAILTLSLPQAVADELKSEDIIKRKAALETATEHAARQFEALLADPNSHNPPDPMMIEFVGHLTSSLFEVADGNQSLLMRFPELVNSLHYLRVIHRAFWSSGATQIGASEVGQQALIVYDVASGTLEDISRT